MNRISLFAGASVALIILVDLATGQGPPSLNNYFNLPGPHPEFRQPPLPPIGYMPRGEYDVKINDKEYEKGKGALKEKEREKERPKLHHPFEQEQENAYDHEKQKEKSTPAPGVLTSFSNSMSDAWKSFSTLGRQTRSVHNTGSSDELSDDITPKPSSVPTYGRSFEEYEWKQFNNQGYIFFKVPKNLVCKN